MGNGEERRREEDSAHTREKRIEAPRVRERGAAEMVGEEPRGRGYHRGEHAGAAGVGEASRWG